MRKLLLATLLSTTFCMVFGFSATTLHAEENAPLGRGTLGVKIGYTQFTDDTSYIDENSSFVAIEAFVKIKKDMPLYLGALAGHGSSSDVILDTMLIEPYELNMKYAKEIQQNLVADVGGGLSYVYAKYTNNNLFGPDIEQSKWLFGAQLFGDLTYKIRWFSVGAWLRYQTTEKFEDVGVNFNNFGGGLQMGGVF